MEITKVREEYFHDRRNLIVGVGDARHQEKQSIIDVVDIISKEITMFDSQNLRTSRIVFTDMCDILFWGALVNHFRKDASMAEKLFPVMYIHLSNKVICFDLHLVQLIFDWKNRLTELIEAEENVFIVSLLQLFIALLGNVMLVPFFFQCDTLLFIIVYNIATPVLYKKVYTFFLDIFITIGAKTLGSRSISILYISCKLIHLILVLEFFLVIFPFTWTCGYIDYLHTDYGLVHYNASNFDGNGIHKCDAIEYLISTDLHFKREQTSIRSQKCSAIPGEYVTLSCNITRNYPTYKHAEFLWISNGKNVRKNKAQTITNRFYQDCFSGKFILVSNLTIHQINEFDFDTYTCLIKLVLCNEISTKQKFFHLFHKGQICIRSSEFVTISGEILLAEYKGYQRKIHAPMGYLLKLRNVFPLRVKANVSSVFVRNYIDLPDTPFKYCFRSVLQYYSLERLTRKTMSNQFSEIEFCLALWHGHHYLRTNFDTGVTILHPNSILILPVTKSTIFTQPGFTNTEYYKHIASAASYDYIDRDKRFLIHSLEVLHYYFINVFDNIIWFLFMLSSAVVFLIEFKLYKYLLSFILKYAAFENPNRPYNENTKDDIFLSFCERSQSDQAFIVEKLLPHLKQVHHYKIRSCHMINAGTNLLAQHSEEIQKCKKVVILWSKDYAEESECRKIISAVILGLHRDDILKLEDIITLRYQSYPVYKRYSFLLGDDSDDIPDDSANSLDIAHECIKRSFAKNRSIIDRIRSTFIVKLVTVIFKFVRYCISYTGYGICLTVNIITFCIVLLLFGSCMQLIRQFLLP